MEDSGGSDGKLSLVCNGLAQPSDKETDSLGDHIVYDFDSYFEDLNDSLTISRVVNDSVIKGMVNAVTEEVAEKIALKDLEIASLKDRLHVYESGACKVEKSEFSRLAADVKQEDPAEGCLHSLWMASESHLHILQRTIEDAKMCRLTPGQSKPKESETWAGVEQALYVFKNYFNTVCTKFDNINCSLKTSNSLGNKEREFQDEVESLVIRDLIRGFLEERKVHLQEQKAKSCSSQSTKELEMFKQLSSLHQEASSISRTLSILEMGHQPLNGSNEVIEECNGGKRNDHFHLKDYSNHISQANSVWESNGKDEESETAMRNIMDPAKLEPKTKDDIIHYFQDEINKMKRNHESKMQERIEEYYSLRREYLKNRGRMVSLKKDKEFEAFREKIPDLVGKLNNLLVENETLALVFEKNDMICNLENRIGTLVSENHQLKDLLSKQNKEIKGLSSQLSNAVDKISHHSLSEANLLKQIRELKCDIEDARIEISVREDVFNCIIKELTDRTKCAIEESHMQLVVMLEMYEIIFRESVGFKATNKCETEDLDIVPIIMQDICGVIFREAAKDAITALNLMTAIYEEEYVRRFSLEASVLVYEEALSLEIEEKGQLKEELLKSLALIEEKKLLLQKEKEQYDLINQELSLLRNQASENEILVSMSQKESKLTEKKLDDALIHMKAYQEKTIELNQKLIEAMDKLEGANAEIKFLYGIIREKETALSLVAASEAEHRKHVQTMIAYEQVAFRAATEFESWAVEAIEKNSLRLGRLKSQVDPLIQTGNSLKKMELVYNQKLEKRYSDLQKAEAEVDLLGDEVDALLSLLEKIYIALYHYSPVLQHYPGVMEILKLIQRELSVETAYNHKGIIETARTV